MRPRKSDDEMDAREARQFLDLLGHRGDTARLDKVAHPSKRAHWLYRATHPGVGTVEGGSDREVWKALCDLAEKQGPLPDRCEGTTKAGRPCANTPQRGERFCGSHLPTPTSEAAPSVNPGLCEAKTKKGRQCQNAPQRGERFCGPHLPRP